MYRVALIVLSAAILCGCGLQPNAWQATTGYGIAAEPLDKSLVGNDALQNVGTDKVGYVARIVNDSEVKCEDFLNRLVLNETSTNTSLDVLTTVFSALGTAFTPLGTVHALTAAGAISSGSKTAIDANIYAKASIANFAQAIQSTYYRDIGNYVSALANADPDSINPSVEVNRIRPIHAECALASAEATISASLQPSPSGSTPAAEQTTVTVNGTPKSGDKFSLNGTASGLKLSVAYTAGPGDTTGEVIAAKMAGIINSQPDFQKAGVTAAQQAGKASFAVSSSPTPKITWSTSSNMSIGSPGAGAAGATPVPAAPGSAAIIVPAAPPVPVPSQASRGVVQMPPVVPGHAVR